jgi:hypothetical protein
MRGRTLYGGTLLAGIPQSITHAPLQHQIERVEFITTQHYASSLICLSSSVVVNLYPSAQLFTSQIDSGK